MSELRDKIAEVVETDIRFEDQKVFISDQARRIADAILPLIREAQAEALEQFANKHEALSNDAIRDLGDELPSYRAGCTDAAMSAVGRLRARAAAYRVGEGESNG